MVVFKILTGFSGFFISIYLKFSTLYNFIKPIETIAFKIPILIDFLK